MSRNLGRGLSALLGEENETEQNAVQSGVKTVAVTDLEPSPFQPRHTFDEEALRDLVESVKTKGVIQPLIVRMGKAGKYEIIGGERRWRRSKQACAKFPFWSRIFPTKKRWKSLLSKTCSGRT